MKHWYSAQELNALAPAPGKERAVQHRATRVGWQSRPRQGQGGGREYAFSPFMGSRGLVPLRRVGQHPTNPWRKQEAGLAVVSAKRKALKMLGTRAKKPKPLLRCGARCWGGGWRLRGGVLAIFAFFWSARTCKFFALLRRCWH